MWSQYEIEIYLIHPEAILRWLGSWYDAAAVDKAKRYMEESFPPVIHKLPFKSDFWADMKGKKVLGKVCNATRLRIGEAEYYGIAAKMRKEEIHPEAVEKLDAIVKQLGIASGGETGDRL